ncbi:MAG: tripartite tricarboxylate transporter substrate binding protein [Betaproteobacteria bacterium]|nr:MAG: tripartite tricarboxylate transporter substrate binding protein [Betaproteobacteria bacterium]
MGVRMTHRLRAVLMLLSCGFVAEATAQLPPGYPSRPVRFLVGFPPGGANDILARKIAQPLSENLGQSVVVENRAGANTAIASEVFVNAAPDGYTIMQVAPGHATNPAMMKLKFDPIKDFQFITVAAESQNLLVVHPTFPPKNVKELIAISKQRPGDINYGSSGIGTTVHLSAELFQYMTGVKWVHIPYKGAGPAMTEFLSGTFALYFGNVPSMIPYVRAGKFRPLAVTSLKRSTAAPDIPTVAESGVPGFEVTTWYGFAAQAKVPRAIVDKLNAEIVRVLNAPAMRDWLNLQGAIVIGNSPEQATAQVEREIAKWTKVIRAAGIKAQ